ncbi:hypothetical protein H310_12918 [Aphanomyces invadans]|uniref:Uncharacterized protein n=1 Tax=Aphanomyces invadans TaxID=157072 RepID=A0A024TFW1_9STRA|nr:hypothetical protein H310_12918 [Aphanomyces invadans]ETV92903.1 hypothetical protein H310_12918 [Aphanomyces invadans]|eukprot:XP_008878424.1 hypothetical protein H310_12918 [Aphanomyces invadans]
MGTEMHVAVQVRKLFRQTEAAYEAELHTSFSPHKVNLHPIPQQQPLSSRRLHSSQATNKTSVNRKQPIHRASTPLLRPLSPVNKPSTAPPGSAQTTPLGHSYRPSSAREIPHPCDIPTTPVAKPKRKPATSRPFQAASDTLLLEMKAYVANRKTSTSSNSSITKGSDASSDGTGKLTKGGGRPNPTKFQRGLQIQMQCYLEYAHLHSKSTRHLNVNPSPTNSHVLATPTPQKFLQKDGGKDSMRNLQDNSSYQKLLRKLSPSITNSATTYMSLVHVLQGCHHCGGRITFCDACERSANEYFNKFSMSELEKSYGRQLPPPDATVVAEYEKYLELREQSMKHKL